MPTTKGTREMPATVDPTPPALPTVTSNAAMMLKKAMPISAEPSWMA